MPQSLLIDGSWRSACEPSGVFHAYNPAHRLALSEHAFPISSWSDLDAMLEAGSRAAAAMVGLAPLRLADFLERYADAIAQRADVLCAVAQRETALAIEPRLRSVELPRTLLQLRQAAQAARDGSWRRPVLDTKANIRSILEPLHAPVLIFGPNNFPFAFNAIAGGDFAAAIAAGNPVIAKAHPGHPQTSALLAEAAAQCASDAQLPDGAVQMFFHTSADLGLRLVADPRIGATAFTGSRKAGLALKAAADAAGKLIYLEMSSTNPVFILAGAQRERGMSIAAELHASCTLGSGQFCTRPGIAVLAAAAETGVFEAELVTRMAQTAPAVLLTPQAPTDLAASTALLVAAGARLLTGGAVAQAAEGYAFEPTLLRVSAEQFLAHRNTFQCDVFGPLCLLVLAADDDELLEVAHALDGNLTASIYSDSAGTDDRQYSELEPILRSRVGRLINDKMPTGVAVSAAMNHGGPFPASAHPGFTAVGIPASLLRFTALRCYDNVRESRLPAALRNAHPGGTLLRCVDGVWSSRDVE